MELLEISAMCLQGLLSNPAYLNHNLTDSNGDKIFRSREDIASDAIWYAEGLLTRRQQIINKNKSLIEDK